MCSYRTARNCVRFRLSVVSQGGVNCFEVKSNYRTYLLLVEQLDRTTPTTLVNNIPSLSTYSHHVVAASLVLQILSSVDTFCSTVKVMAPPHANPTDLTPNAGSTSPPTKLLLITFFAMCMFVVPNIYGSLNVQMSAEMTSMSLQDLGVEPPVLQRGNVRLLPPSDAVTVVATLHDVVNRTPTTRPRTGIMDPRNTNSGMERPKMADVRSGANGIENSGGDVAAQTNSSKVKEEIVITAEENVEEKHPNTTATQGSKEAKSKPLNILVLYPDDWRHDTIGKENSIVQTPFLDSLADQGIRFRQNAVTSSICWISRATLFTGQWPSRHQSHKLYCPHFAAGYTWKESSWPAMLQQHGYYTGHVVCVAPKDLTMVVASSFLMEFLMMYRGNGNTKIRMKVALTCTRQSKGSTGSKNLEGGMYRPRTLQRKKPLKF
jgi:Sulfatase